RFRMVSKVNEYLGRADNEILLSEKIKQITEDKPARVMLNIPDNATFYSAVISHSYYAIFYSAKAILLSRDIVTEAPNVHARTLEEFKKNFIDTGILDTKLLMIYNQMIIRAETLLEIFKLEKGKRGDFTYKTIAQANKAPAEESINNAKTFFRHIKAVL
ncbi:HEPN domain-containing protein, partial [Candidatus Woesearchaeota archaeon]|nr:HEPN domain-containing protein [Candidatus Woesearchaeota archaeon]